MKPQKTARIFTFSLFLTIKIIKIRSINTPKYQLLLILRKDKKTIVTALEKVNKKSEKRPFKILNLAKEWAKTHRSFAKNLLQKCKITAFSMQYGCF